MATIRGADHRIQSARRRVRAQARRARFSILLERVARAFWPLWAVIAGFLGLALLGAPQALPFWGHLAALALFAGGAGWALWRGARAFRWPSDPEARARLDADTVDRPVAAIDDMLAANAGSGTAEGVWAAHRARMAERAARARAAPADLRVSDRDRFALRHAALLALGAGVLAQLGDGGARLAEALNPVAAAPAAAGVVGPTLEAWASPPVYTGAAPIYLTERDGDALLRLPVGSEITLRVFDAPEAPTLENGVAEPTAFAEAGPGVWDATATLRESGAIGAGVGGAPLGGWRIEAIPDAPPAIAFTEAPAAQRSGALGFAFEASDDYGVVGARAEIRLDAEMTEIDGFARDSVYDVARFPLPLPLTGDAEALSEEVVEDLTPHPFAGLPVALSLVATDGAGQEGAVEARLEMPARRFFEPLAKAIIEQRRLFAWSLDSAERVSRVLAAVTAHPDDLFDDMTAYLTLRTAMRRLDIAIADERLREEAEGIVDLLWDAALRIEDGDLSEAERRLRELQERLSEALEEGASQDEIDRLMQELRQALNDYLQQLAQEALRDQAEGEQQPPVDPDQLLTEQDLQSMLDQLEEALRNGMEEMARQMLQQLQQMLENLQMAQPGQPQQGGGQGDQAMRELQDMIDRQQGLADRSFDALREGREGQQGQQGQRGQQSQRGQGGQQPGQGGRRPGQGEGEGQGRQFGENQGQGQGGGRGRGDLGGISRDQEALRRLLEDLRGRLPGEGGGESLGRAEERMGAARDSLDQGDADGALNDQVEALDALREGAQELAQQMQQPGQAQQAGRDGRSGDVRDEDPFGRPTASDGPMDGDSVRVPDAEIMKRARELMDEIRRRAGDRTRPPAELDYLERLLDRF